VVPVLRPVTYAVILLPGFESADESKLERKRSIPAIRPTSPPLAPSREGNQMYSNTWQ